MTAAKKNYSIALVLMFIALVVSFAILLTAVKGDSVLRIVLAAGGFVGFLGLYVGVLVASKRAPTA